MSRLIDTAILGGGASGLFLGSLLKKNYLVIEHNKEIGAKIRISGGGKCNITNKIVTENNYRGDKELVRKVLKKFSNKDLLSWLKRNNLEVVEAKKNQYFFKSSEILLNFFKRNVKKILKAEIIEVKFEKDRFKIITDKQFFYAKNVVVATGGISYKKLGASDIGYKIAKNFGHTITPLRPALVGLTVQKSESWFKNLSGISFESVVKASEKKFRQNILFSHRGITGPAVLNVSLWWDKGKISIGFLKKDVFTFLKNPNKQISTQLPLPKRFVKEFLNAQNLEDKKVKLLSNAEKEKLKLLNNYEFAPAGTFGFERAEVTKGGVDTNDLNEFLESKFQKRLYFVGEVLDVTGELGGYNFQWAFSSAYSVYLNLIKRLTIED
ncbi:MULTISPECIES: NAD(P)/FAD-dependent oxidoreductase [unclassified Lebetimonas]|uniref:NAD(P)/FAD-dependent oxidoreductase n=1 Tax=unclassified Lebetimonas TaxID=2648158 RepID=UPI0006882E52|nr:MULTISPECIES: aminoacetone oxidase family FAD-binding enzyme [unclassified Lebetimonas]